jgi:hypothetical protein
MTEEVAEEIIFNFWYICDGSVIYHIRAKPYVHAGTDSEKMAFLQERARLDYLIAQPFDVAEKCFSKKPISGDDGSERLPVGDMEAAMLPEYRNLLLEEAFEIMGNNLPSQTKLTIPDEPIMCITPVITDDDGIIIGPFPIWRQGLDIES